MAQNSILEFLKNFPRNTIQRLKRLPKMKKEMARLEKLSQELYREGTPKYLQEKKEQAEKAYASLTTPKEKILFYCRYFAKYAVPQIKSNALKYAYVMTYLSETTDLIPKDAPFILLPYFESNSADALEKLFTERLSKPFDKTEKRIYSSLLTPSDNEPLSDEYKLQCLIVAMCEKPEKQERCGRWPYSFQLNENLYRNAKNV